MTHPPDDLTPEERHRQQERLLMEYLARTPTQRALRRAAIRERLKLPLEHRGAWRFPDVGEQPPSLPPAAPTTERFGAWGFRVIAPPVIETYGSYRLMRYVHVRGTPVRECVFRSRTLEGIWTFVRRVRAGGHRSSRCWIERASHPAGRSNTWRAA